MIFRTRCLLAAVLLAQGLLPVRCHSQVALPAPQVAGSAAKRTSDVSWPAGASPEEEITIKALTQEKHGAQFTLQGNASVHSSAYDLSADEITYDSQSGDASAQGHVVLTGALNDERIQARRAEYNVRLESGRFYDVTGTVGMRVAGGQPEITSPNPFIFTGKLVEKTGPDHYLVRDGSVTTCEMPDPKWQFFAQRVTVDVGGNAAIYHSTFRLHGIPVFYFPYATHPVEKNARESGFLIPNVGNSNTKGFIVGESVFLVINRSMDVTAGTQYYSLRGWAPHAQFRARPSTTSFVDFNYQGMFDRGIGYPPVDEGGQNVRLNAEAQFPAAFRGVARIDYLSSYLYRLAFNEVFTQPVNSEVKSVAFLSSTHNGFSYNAMGSRYQNFESTNNGDVITILHAPSFGFSSVERALPRTPFYWALDAAGEGLSRSEPLFTTSGLVGRFDIHPTLSMPLLFRGWSVRPAIGLRETAYTQQLTPNSGIGTVNDEPINRNALETSVEVLPPAVSKVFKGNWLGRRFKHVIEPRVTYRYVTGVNNFANILRFDERDILSNTHEVEYAVVNRLYTKRLASTPADCTQPNMPSLTIGEAPSETGVPWARPTTSEAPCETAPVAHEVVTWELKQKYFLDDTFGGALQPGNRNVFATTAELTGIAFLTQPRHLSPLVSTLRVATSEHTDAEWILDYDFQLSRINGSTALLNYYIGPFTIGGADTLLRVFDETTSSGTQSTPVPEFHQFRLLGGYGRVNKPGFSVAGSVGYDAKVGFLQAAAAQVSYNWDCCGLSVEYRRFALGSVRNENQYRFVFSLANLVSLGNLRRQARLF
jgi:LPS-assembly protein